MSPPVPKAALRKPAAPDPEHQHADREHDHQQVDRALDHRRADGKRDQRARARARGDHPRGGEQLAEGALLGLLIPRHDGDRTDGDQQWCRQQESGEHGAGQARPVDAHEHARERRAEQRSHGLAPARRHVRRCQLVRVAHHLRQQRRVRRAGDAERQPEGDRRAVHDHDGRVGEDRRATAARASPPKPRNPSAAAARRRAGTGGR